MGSLLPESDRPFAGIGVVVRIEVVDLFASAEGDGRVAVSFQIERMAGAIFVTDGLHHHLFDLRQKIVGRLPLGRSDVTDGHVETQVDVFFIVRILECVDEAIAVGTLDDLVVLPVGIVDAHTSTSLNKFPLHAQSDACRFFICPALLLL